MNAPTPATAETDARVSERPPNAWRLEQAMAALHSARRRLLEEDPDIASDERLFSDMLEGESGDAMDVLDRVLRASQEAKAMAAMAEARASEMSLRRDRYKARSEALRGAAFAAMDSLGMRRRDLPELTASISAGQVAVVITDETQLPEAFIRVKREPDKALISAALKAGNTVAGAEITNGLPRLTVRTK